MRLGVSCKLIVNHFFIVLLEENCWSALGKFSFFFYENDLRVFFAVVRERERDAGGYRWEGREKGE
jgi:hypothetical protein